MATIMDHTRRTAVRDLIAALVDSASDAGQREAIGRLLPKLEQYANEHLECAGGLAEVRAHLSGAFLVALGPDAARKTLLRVVEEAEQIDDQHARAQALIEAAANAGALGGLGTDLLERVEQLAAALEPGPAKAQLFAVLCQAFNRTKNSKKAGKMAIRALNNAEKVSDPESRVVALSAVATELRKIGASADVSEALDRARAVADGIEDKLARCRAFVSLAAALCKVGRGDEGLTTLSRVLGNGQPEAKTEPATDPAPAPARPAPAEQAEPKNGNDPLFEEKAGLDNSWDDPTQGVKFPGYSGIRRRRR